MARLVDHSRRRHHQRIARLPSGRAGGEIARFDPQHALGGSENPTQRANLDDPGGDARARRHRVPRIRRQDPRRHPPRRRQEPAHGRSGAHRRIRALGQIDRARLGQGDCRRSRGHGLFRHARCFRPGERNCRRDGKPHRTRPHQPIARRRQRARDAAAASDQEVRLCDHGHHPDHRRDHLRLRASRPRHSVRQNVPGGDWHRRLDDPGRTASPHHHYARDRRPAHGGPQRHRAAPAGGRDAGLGRAHLLGQDRHADAHGNDGRFGGDRRRYAQSHRRRLRQRRPGAQGRRARRQTNPALELLGRVSALCNDAELRKVDGVWKVEGDPTEGALYPFAAKLGMDRQKEQAAYPRIDAIPFESEHRFMATLHKAPEGGEILLVKGAPEAILDACDRQQDAAGSEAARSRLFREGLRRARGARRAGAGACVAARSRRQSRKPRARPICRRISCCSASSASSIRRARKRSRR